MGWVAFDPSPSPDKSGTPPPAATERRAVAVEVPPALPPAAPGAVTAESAAQSPEDTPSDGSAPITDRSGFEVALWVLAGIGTLCALLALPAVIIMAVRSRVVAGDDKRRRPTSRSPADGSWATAPLLLLDSSSPSEGSAAPR